MTTIEWTRGDDGSPGVTWNPTTGCDRVSAGCDNCYALKMAKRLKDMGSPKYQRDGDLRTSGPGFGLTVHHDTLDLPFTWRRPRRVFVNSMSDLFHDHVPSAFIASVFDVMRQTPQHTYQILTKRHGRLRSLMRTAVPGEGWPLPNVWLGVSIENQKAADLRVPALLDTPAAVRFVSAEPLLGPVDLTQVAVGTARIDGLRADVKTTAGEVYAAAPGALSWVIVGGESGHGARPMELDWARSLVEQCQAANVPVFCKQLGSVWAQQQTSSDKKGGDPASWPTELAIRKFPAVAP